jgi:hypothetical protein
VSTPPSLSALQQLKPVQGFLPTTFLERGVTVPFTTPLLAGARARPAERNHLELIVPCPSGERTVYVLSWDDVVPLCRPTLHDRRLSGAVASLPRLTPAAIRRLAREVATQGLAGRGAAAAARDAEQADEEARLAAKFGLLPALVRQIEPQGENAVPPEAERPDELERRAERAVELIAPALGCSPAAVAVSLQQIAAAFGGTGIEQGAPSARIPATIAGMMQLRQELGEHAKRHPDDDGPEADLVAGVAGMTTVLASAMLADAHALTGDIVALLRRWMTDPDALTTLLARPDWLLDGWDRICALWRTAESHLGRGPALIEMARLVPLLPPEARDWASQQVDVDTALLRHRRKVARLGDWRTGVTVLDVIARNETLLEHTA